MGPILYLLYAYTCDIPHAENVMVVTFSDDKDVLVIENSSEEAARKIQETIWELTSRG